MIRHLRVTLMLLIMAKGSPIIFSKWVWRQFFLESNPSCLLSQHLTNLIKGLNSCKVITQVKSPHSTLVSQLLVHNNMNKNCCQYHSKISSHLEQHFFIGLWREKEKKQNCCSNALYQVAASKGHPIYPMNSRFLSSYILSSCIVWQVLEHSVHVFCTTIAVFCRDIHFSTSRWQCS